MIFLLFFVGPKISIASSIDDEVDFYIKQQKQLEQQIKKGKQIFEQFLRQEARKRGIEVPKYGESEYQKILFEYAEQSDSFRQKDPKKWEEIDAYAYDYWEKNIMPLLEQQEREKPKQTPSDVQAQAGVYNRYGAVNYARTYAGYYDDNPYYRNYNPYYRPMDNDCTNFVSQALWQGGGIPMVDAWWRTKYDKDDWYYYHKGTDSFDSNYDDNWSWSWSKVGTLYYHITSRLGKQVYSESEVQLGDIVQVDGADGSAPNGVWDHSMVVTGLSPLRVTYHTTNRKDKILTEVPGAKRFLHITY